MSDTPTENADVSELAQQVVAELKPGTTIADKVILSRRQLVAIAGGSISVGALMKFGVSEAQAQEAVGAVGTEADPIDVFASTVEASQVGSDGSEADVFASTLSFPTTEPFEIEIDDDAQEVRFNR